MDREFLITKVFPYGAVELEKKDDTRFIVNGQRIKIYLGHAESVHAVVQAYHIDEVWLIKGHVLYRNIKSSVRGRKPKVYTLANDRFCYVRRKSCSFV